MSVDLTARVGSVVLSNPVMTASGTAGHGTELAAYLDVARLGAFVAKSVAAFPWGGNPAPRIHPTAAGMLNSVGLQGPGVDQWMHDDLPALISRGATVVASIWGRTLDDYAAAALTLATAPAEVVAVEVNLSCPNLRGKGMFAQSPDATREAMAVTEVVGRPRWAKLTAAVSDLVEVATAARDGGAAAVTLVNTVPGMAIDTERRVPALGGRTGGLSGPAMHPIAVKAVFEVRAALPDLPIVGVGGVVCAHDAVELLMAGANAVAIGTATFADPGAPIRLVEGLARWCAARSVARLSDIIGAAHEPERGTRGF